MLAKTTKDISFHQILIPMNEHFLPQFFSKVFRLKHIRKIKQASRLNQPCFWRHIFEDISYLGKDSSIATFTQKHQWRIRASMHVQLLSWRQTKNAVVCAIEWDIRKSLSLPKLNEILLGCPGILFCLASKCESSGQNYVEQPKFAQNLKIYTVPKEIKGLVTSAATWSGRKV